MLFENENTKWKCSKNIAVFEKMKTFTVKYSYIQVKQQFQLNQIYYKGNPTELQIQVVISDIYILWRKE